MLGLLVDGDEESGYAIPKRLCSIPVSSDKVGPLLPSGDELRVEEEESYSQNPALVYCHFTVDGELALVIEVNEFSEPFDIMQRYEDHPSVYGIERAEDATIAGEPALVGPDGALVQVGCPARGEEAVLDVNVRYQGTWEDPAAGAAGCGGVHRGPRGVVVGPLLVCGRGVVVVARLFTEEFVPSVARQYGCAGGVDPSAQCECAGGVSVGSGTVVGG